MRAASAFDSVASSLQQVIPLPSSYATLLSLHNAPFVTHPRVRVLLSTYCLWIALTTAQPSQSPRKFDLLPAQSFAMLGQLKLQIPCRTRHYGVFPPPSFAPFCLVTPTYPCSPSSPTSAPSSVRPRRVRTRNAGGGAAAASPQTLDVEVGGSVRVSAFMPPNGIASPLSSSPDSSRAPSREGSLPPRQTPSPAPRSRHPNGVPSPLSSSPPSPSMSDS